MSDELTTLRFWMAQFPERNRVEEFRETFGRAIMRLDIDPLLGHHLEIDVTVRGFSRLGFASGRVVADAQHA